MPLSRDEVKHIATLCRIGVTDEDLDDMADQLSHILDLFQVLQELDTADVPSTGHSMTPGNVMRADEPEPSYPQKEVLKNVPKTRGDQMQVKVVLEDTEG